MVQINKGPNAFTWSLYNGLNLLLNQCNY